MHAAVCGRDGKSLSGMGPGLQASRVIRCKNTAEQSKFRVSSEEKKARAIGPGFSGSKGLVVGRPVGIFLPVHRGCLAESQCSSWDS